MPTLNKTYDFSSDTWTKVAGGNLTPVHSASGGNSGGCYSFAVSGRRAVGTGYIELTTTWESLGIPSGSVINEIDSSSFDWICDQWSADSTGYTIGALSVHDNSGTLQATLISSQAGSGSTSYATKSGSVASIPVAIQDSNDTIKIRLYVTCENGNAKTVTTGVKIDNLDFNIDYSEAAIQITGDDTNQSQSIETGSIAQVHSIQGDDLAQAQAIETGNISQSHSIAASGLNQSQSLETGEISVTVEVNISGDNLSHSQGLESGQISQLHEITAEGLSQSQSAEVGTFGQVHQITADNLTQPHTLESGSLSQDIEIQAQNLTQSQVLIEGNFSQSITIQAEDLNHSQQISTGNLTAEITFTGDNLSHSQSIESGTVEEIGPIEGDELNQGQELQGGEMSQEITIQANDITQTTELNNGTISQVHLLSGDNLDQNQDMTVIGSVLSFVFTPGGNCLECDVELNRSKNFTIFVARGKEFNVTLSREKP